MSINKVVFPVAGLGTRLLPASKAIPKEMLPVVDKPLIQYAVEEAVTAGMTELIFITGHGKDSIADHFDRALELENLLIKKEQHELLSSIRDIVPDDVTCTYIRQPESLGLGHAILCSHAAVGNEPFAVVLPDDLIDAGPRGVLSQLVDDHMQHGSSIIAVENVHESQTDRYGIVEMERIGSRGGRIINIIEKPAPHVAPSTLGVVGRYILTPEVFAILKKTGRGAGGEIQLTDAIASLLKHQPVYIHEFEGVRYDCGNKLGYLQATIEYGMKHPEIGEDLTRYLKSLPALIS